MEALTILLLIMVIIISLFYVVVSGTLELFYREGSWVMSDVRDSLNKPRTNRQVVQSVFARLTILGAIYYGSVHIVDLRGLALGAYFTYFAMQLLIFIQYVMYSKKTSRVFFSFIYMLFVALMFYPLFGG